MGVTPRVGYRDAIQEAAEHPWRVVGEAAVLVLLVAVLGALVVVGWGMAS